MRIIDWSSEVCSSDLSKVECGERNHEGEERQPEPGGRPKPVSKQEFHRLSVLWRRQQPCGPCRAGPLVRDQAWRRIRGKGGAWSSPLVDLRSSGEPCFWGERAAPRASPTRIIRRRTTAQAMARQKGPSRNPVHGKRQ